MDNGKLIIENGGVGGKLWGLETGRIMLIPLSRKHLDLLSKNREELEIDLGLVPLERQVSEEMQAEIEDALGFWKKFVDRYPEEYAWGTNWEIILKNINQSIGSIGLSGLPNKEGKVAIGYVIDDRFQRKGLASEAVGLMKDWIFRHPDAKCIIAYTPKDNLPSQKVLLKNDFKKIGETTEEGLDCFVWELKGPNI